MMALWTVCVTVCISGDNSSRPEREVMPLVNDNERQEEPSMKTRMHAWAIAALAGAVLTFVALGGFVFASVVCYTEWNCITSSLREKRNPSYPTNLQWSGWADASGKLLPLGGTGWPTQVTVQCRRGTSSDLVGSWMLHQVKWQSPSGTEIVVWARGDESPRAPHVRALLTVGGVGVVLLVYAAGIRVFQPRVGRQSRDSGSNS